MANLTAILLVFVMLITLHVEHQLHLVVASTDSNVLVATLGSTGISSFTLNLHVGTSPQTLPLLLDLQSPFTTLPCTDQDLNSSSSFHPSLSSTFLTPDTSPAACIPLPTSSSDSSSPSPSPMRSCSCAQDTISLYVQRTAFPDPLLTANVSAVNFTCCAEVGSSIAAAGVAGFSKGDRSLPAQISKRAGLARQFSYCLPSIAFFGRVTTYALLNAPVGQMETFTTSLTTRLYYVKGGGYAFKLFNMSIDGGGGGVMRKPMKMRVSTTQSYTTLERSVYKALRQSFRQAIGYRTVVKAVPAIEPFDTCFDYMPLYYAGQAPYLKTPTMTFEAEGGAAWGLYPRSTFVNINGSNSGVACMGFLKAPPGQPSVLGTFQQLDCLAEFDLEHSRFGFRSIFHPFVIRPEAPRCGSLAYPMYPPT